MKRKDYQKPTMNIVQLQQQQQLLAGSGQQGQSTTQSYTYHGEVEE